jgi:hypothetical protein
MKLSFFLIIIHFFIKNNLKSNGINKDTVDVFLKDVLQFKEKYCKRIESEEKKIINKEDYKIFFEQKKNKNH